MAEKIETRTGPGAAQLPRVKVSSAGGNHHEAGARHLDSPASKISFSGLGKAIANNAEASASMAKISKAPLSTSRAAMRDEVAHANRASSEASVDEVEDLADNIARDISVRPEQAINAFKGPRSSAADLLKH